MTSHFEALDAERAISRRVLECALMAEVDRAIRSGVPARVALVALLSTVAKVETMDYEAHRAAHA